MRWISAICLALGATSSAAFANDGEVHSFHCLHGCPVGAPSTNDLVVREIYILSNNDLTRMADWVAYRLTPDTIGPSPRRNWSADPALRPEERLDEDQYADAPGVLHIDRGHQAPLAAFSGTSFAQETNILSNITPQASALNQGPWQELEGAERRLAVEDGIAVYVTTGPLFERVMRPMPNGPALHRVPSGYWKVIATQDGRVTAFIFDQNTPRNADFCDHRTSLLEVQLRGRLQLFPMADHATLSALDAALGCDRPPPPPAMPAEITTR